MSIKFPEIKAFDTAQFEAFATAADRRPRGSRPSPLKRRTIQRSPFETRQLCEKLVGVKKIDEAIKLQSDFAKSAYEDFVAQATKLGGMYSSLAKEMFKTINAASPAQPSVVAQPWQAPPPQSRTVLHRLARRISAKENRSMNFDHRAVFWCSVCWRWLNALGRTCGQAGIEHMLDIFANEMRVAMTLTGVASVSRIYRTDSCLKWPVDIQKGLGRA